MPIEEWNAYEIGYRPCTTETGGKASAWEPSGNFINFTPKSLKVSIETVATSSSGRNAAGNMYVKYVKSGLRKLEIELPPYAINDTNYKDIANNMVGRVVQIRYKDPYGKVDPNQGTTTYEYYTSKFYCSSASGNYYSGVILDGVVQGVTFNLIEME